MVDRYGEAIEADLHAEYGLDLHDFFRGRYPWAKLERLTNRLMKTPRSALQVALAQDDEAAERALEESEKDRNISRTPPLETWTPEVEWLVANFDRMGELIQAVLATAPGKSKPPTIRPARRPETAIDRARRRKAWRSHDALVAEVREAQERYHGV